MITKIACVITKYYVCHSAALQALTGLTNPAMTSAPADYSHDAFLIQYDYRPSDTDTTWEHEITFTDDDCLEEDESVGFKVVPVTTGCDEACVDAEVAGGTTAEATMSAAAEGSADEDGVDA